MLHKLLDSPVISWFDLDVHSNSCIRIFYQVSVYFHQIDALGQNPNAV